MTWHVIERRRALAVGRLLAGEIRAPTASIAAPSPAASRVLAATQRRRPRPRRGRNTVSFVLVSPSTLSWSHVRAAAGRSSAWSVGRLDRRVGEDDREHRRHPRVDHPDALGDAGDPDARGPARPSGSGSVDRRRSRPSSACRSSGAPRRPRRAPSSVAARRRRERVDAGGDHVERQPRADDPGREAGASALRAIPSAPASNPATSAWSASPAAPVAALARAARRDDRLAQPEARRSPAGVGLARCARDSRTGAAANAFGVKTAAAPRPRAPARRWRRSRGPADPTP